jgi:hypothetical protein
VLPARNGKEIAHAGETSVRLNLIVAWREAKVFTEAERAALELTEQGTRIADAAGGVTDDAWANAAKHYDDDRSRHAGSRPAESPTATSLGTACSEVVTASMVRAAPHACTTVFGVPASLVAARRLFGSAGRERRAENR